MGIGTSYIDREGRNIRGDWMPTEQKEFAELAKEQETRDLGTGKISSDETKKTVPAREYGQKGLSSESRPGMLFTVEHPEGMPIDKNGVPVKKAVAIKLVPKPDKDQSQDNLGIAA